MDRLSDLEKNIGFALVHLRRAGKVVRGAKLASTVFGAILVAASPFVATKVQVPNAAAISDIIFWVGVALTLFGGVFLIWFDDTTPDILSENLRLSKEVARKEKLLSYYDDFTNHILARVSLTSNLREVLEVAVLSEELSLTKSQDFCARILGCVVNRRTALFDIGEEKWTFSVYLFDESSGKLVCQVTRRDSPLPEGYKCREWAVGEGHVGLTFSKKNDLIFSDISNYSLRDVIKARDDNFREDDERLYKSIAAVPICSLENDEPIGIFVATSDVVGRFATEQERSDEDWEREDVLREVAKILALLFQIGESEA